MTDPAAAASDIAAGYAVTGTALELGAVSVDGTVTSGAAVRIPLSRMNRHGLVAGATGTGKTKTLQLIVEQLSANGVPVVLADIKGDLSGLSNPGVSGEKIAARTQRTGDDCLAGFSGNRCPDPGDDHLVWTHLAEYSLGPQRQSGVFAALDLSLDRSEWSAAAGFDGSARPW